MPTKTQMYAQMAEEAACQVTGSRENWTSFLTTAARLYKYPYHEQLMIHKQRPEATACAEYDFWNKWGRYVKRGSKGIALIDYTGDWPRLRYVFDVSDTGSLRKSRPVKLWTMEDEYRKPVMEALEKSYGISATESSFEDQLEKIARQLATEYWDDFGKNIIDIVDDSFLMEYDEYNIGASFRNAATVSITYALYSRCCGNPDDYFEHEDFLDIFDFNTRQTANALGTAVSELSSQVFREIEVTIRNYERMKQVERSQDDERDHLQTGWRFPDSQHRADTHGEQATGQVRENASSLPEGAQSYAPERFDPQREAVPAPVGDRQNSTPESGAADERAAGAESRTGQSNSADGMGAAHEQLESTGGGKRDIGAGEQLNLNLFLSEAEQISLIDKAESKKPSAFSFSGEQIDQILIAGGNEPNKPEKPLPENYVITDDNLGEGGAKLKYVRNVAAIRTLFALEEENRTPTPEEQEILANYVGWGGLADAFDPNKPAWAQEYANLKKLLPEREYEAARASTLNAHFTSPTVIRAIYDAVGRMGFETGNILEPSMGVGNFFGMLPPEMRNSQLYGVELDSITGRIAQKLYPKADITVAGFETTNRRDFFDLAVGNVPFGNYKVADKPYDKLGFSIHNYFFAKALDQVRPGGVIAFVTSRYTMDSKNMDARKYIAQRAELLGAIRLPNNAFKANAGTEVVSDIIFLQKRDHPIDIVPDWVHLNTTPDGFTMNSYFVEHPEMVLGELTTESTQYGKEDLTVRPREGVELSELLREAVTHIEGTYTPVELMEDVESQEKEQITIPARPDVKNFSYTVVDGEVYFRENSVMRLVELNDKAKERVCGMVELRRIVKNRF